MTAPMTSLRLDDLREISHSDGLSPSSAHEALEEICRLRAAMIEDTEFTLAEEARLKVELSNTKALVITVQADRDRMERVSVTLAKQLARVNDFVNDVLAADLSAPDAPSESDWLVAWAKKMIEDRKWCRG